MRTVVVALMGMSLFALPALVGCDREVSKHETVEQKDDGTTIKKKTETRETPSGGIVHEEEKKVDRP